MLTGTKENRPMITRRRRLGLNQALFSTGLMLWSLGCDRAGTDAQTSTSGDQSPNESEKEESSNNATPSTSQDKVKKRKLGATCEKDRDCKSDTCRRVSTRNDPTKYSEKKLCTECDRDKDCGVGGRCIWTIEDSKATYSCDRLQEGESPEVPTEAYLGRPCSSNKDCGGLGCSELVEEGFATGVFTCGECSIKEDDCHGRFQTCITHPNGKYNTCANTVGAPDNSPCRSDIQCEHYCEQHEINAGDIFKWGFCVRCRSDDDCHEKSWCRRAVVHPIEHWITPASCEYGEKPDADDKQP